MLPASIISVSSSVTSFLSSIGEIFLSLPYFIKLAKNVPGEVTILRCSGNGVYRKISTGRNAKSEANEQLLTTKVVNSFRKVYSCYTFALFVIPAFAGMTNGH